MQSLNHALKLLVNQYRLQTDDMDLCRAQFREFVHQVPLMYLVVCWNAVAVAFTFRNEASPLLSCVFPLVLCTVGYLRGRWWLRNSKANFTDQQILRHIRLTGRLAFVLTAGFTAWALLLYPQGDHLMKSHLTFFLALTQISSVFCLFPLRPAALAVATVASLPFLAFFAVVDGGQMLAEALMLTMVAGAMVVILYKYNATFAKLIRSRHVLRQRQLETQKLSDENRRIAFTDPLSGLPNRRALLSRLEILANEPRKAPGDLAMVFIDLDGFKVINDIHGHQLGDELIRKVGETLGRLQPSQSMLVRMGGDEFALLVEGNSSGEVACDFAKSALASLAQPVQIAGHQFQIGGSIGVAVDGDAQTDPFELLRRADTAMYAVKAKGKRSVQVYDASLDEERRRRHLLELEIAEGLARCEFDVVYQPIVEAMSERVVCVEALVRWPGRPAGPLMPDDFIGVAEGSGTIQALGMYVLERACRETHHMDDVRLSVNVAPTQFNNPDFCRHVQNILELTRFPPERLQLEITERHLIDYPERASLAIDTLRALGVSFALDDFGTGFTSIAYLQSFGFSCVKIDRSLTKRLEHDPKAGYLISGLVQMARGLDVSVVAEGVETSHLAELLRLTGCLELQGYHFGRPGALEQIVPGRYSVSAVA